MNSYDIFKKLTRGIKFDHQRFQNDFKKLRAQETAERKIPVADENYTAVDLSKDSFPSKNTNEEDENGNSMLSDDLLGVTDELTKKKKKKKKKKKTDDKQKQLKLHKEQINHLRKKNGIHVWGADVPEPLDTFDKLSEVFGVNERIINNLHNEGYSSPTPIQMQAWPLMMQGREILGSAPTGSGKTAAFLVPVLHQLGGPQRKGFRAVILSPTRELAKQIHRECVRLSEGIGLRTHIINNVNTAKQKFGPQSAQKYDILVTTPNRLVHLLQEGDTPVINMSNVEWLVIDESDRLFEAGVKGFRDQLAAVYRACTGPNVRRALFSATFAQEVEHWCKLNLDNVAMVSIGIRNTASEDVKQELLFCGDEHGKLIALRDIFRKGYEPPVLLFVQTKERAKELFKELVYDNMMVDAIHADRTQLQRDNVVRAFRERKIWVLICTELMARGIDFRGVNLVINYDLPPSTISYIHRVGRTGRAHHQGRAVTFWTMADKPCIRSIAQVIHSSGQEIPSWMLHLKKPKRAEKKKLAKKQPDRGHVSQNAMQEKKLQEKRKKLKAKRKLKAAEAAGDVNEAEKICQDNPMEPKQKKVKKS